MEERDVHNSVNLSIVWVEGMCTTVLTSSLGCERDMHNVDNSPPMGKPGTNVTQTRYRKHPRTRKPGMSNTLFFLPKSVKHHFLQ